MRIGRPLLKLPLRFDGEALAREISALPQKAWVEHPEKFDGNVAVPLITPGGAITNSIAGPMAPTEWLRRCPYILEIMQAMDSTWGRSRLMGLKAGAEVPEHVDLNYYWRTHLRVHIPVITNPDVAFTCDNETVHMKAGECWLLDSFYRHSVANRGSETRIHLVLDTVGSAALWDLIDAALGEQADKRFIPPGSTEPRTIGFERINSPLVMSPWEMKTHVAYLAEWPPEQPCREAAFRMFERFVMAWEGTWARYGASDEGIPIYAEHLNDIRRALVTAWPGPVAMRNDVGLRDAMVGLVLANALAPSMIERLQAQRQGSRFHQTA